MKILIVEDEIDILQEIRSYLRKEDFICEIADNYDSADEKLSI